MELRSIEPEFFALATEPSQAVLDGRGPDALALDTGSQLTLDLTLLEQLPKALVGSYLIG